MSNKPKFASGTGKPLYHPEGKPAYCPECNECGQCEGCGANLPGCPDASCCTPSRWEVVISGITDPEPDCKDCGDYVSNWDFSPVPANGTHTLTQVAPCKWAKPLGQITLTATLWEDDDCAGDSATVSTTQNWWVKLQRILTGPERWRLAVIAGATALTDINPSENDTLTDHTINATSNRCDQDLTFTGGADLFVCTGNFDTLPSSQWSFLNTVSDTQTAEVCP